MQEQLKSLSLFVKEILVHVWTIAENTSNATKRVRWVPKTKGDDRPGRIGKESPNLDDVIGRAISESLLWSCHEHSEGCVKPLYDSKALTVSSKTIGVIRRARSHGEAMEGETTKQAWVIDFIEMCRRVNANGWRHRRNLFNEIRLQQPQQKKDIKKLLGSQLGNIKVVDLILSYGLPSILQDDNVNTWESLSHSTAPTEDIMEFTRDFLEWWGRVVQSLDAYSKMSATNKAEPYVYVFRCAYGPCVNWYTLEWGPICSEWEDYNRQLLMCWFSQL